MKNFCVVLLFLLFSYTWSSCSELQRVANQLPQETVGGNDIGNALREALDNGVEKEVVRLAEAGGFYYNRDVRIVLPEALQAMDRMLRKVGLEELADEGLLLMNRAAEEAVKEGIPIFSEAIRKISFQDAREILLGADTAATTYLQAKTRESLYARFKPVIAKEFREVGAEATWRTIITRYNEMPLTQEVNPDLTDYVTRRALDGVFHRIAEEEIEIRNSTGARTSPLLRRVFALQDRDVP